MLMLKRAVDAAFSEISSTLLLNVFNTCPFSMQAVLCEQPLVLQHVRITVMHWV